MNLLLLTSDDFAPGRSDVAVLYGRRLKHLVTVFKAEPGKVLRAGLKNGLVGEGTVVLMEKDRAELRVSFATPPPLPLPLILICALPRPKSFKKVVESATSLGIKTMYFIESWRVDKSYWQSPVLAQEAVDELMTLGLEQSRDTVVPAVYFKNRFKPFVEDELPGIVAGKLALVAHPYEAQACPFAVAQPVVLLIGPEGGFIPYEIEMLRKTGCTPVTIGSRILRVETAVAAFAGRFW